MELSKAKIHRKETFADIEKYIIDAAESGLYFLQYAIYESKYHILNDCIEYLKNNGYKVTSSPETFRGDKSNNGRRPESYKIILIDWNLNEN